MELLTVLLVVVPFAVAAVLAVTRASRPRAVLVVSAGTLVAALSVAAVVVAGRRDDPFGALPDGLPVAGLTTVAEAVLALVAIGFAVAYRRPLPGLLGLAQLVLTGWLALPGNASGPDPQRLLRFDRLTAVMVLVIGIVGPLICVQALGYLRDYHRGHPQVRDRSPLFHALLFGFLGAMVGLVTVNWLPGLLVFWELTTLCSFLLIGYTRTERTIGYAFRALTVNLFGGVAFQLAIVVLERGGDGADLARIGSGPASGPVLTAAALLSVAAMTKSAQLPFSDWLLGAMHAPTPTSALLHSSTMVKAGVFLLLRLSPAIGGSTVGTLVTVIGLLTFLFAAAVAVAEPDVKSLLAWSTIGYLGLITGCAGAGTPAAVWAGVMLLVFHAAAKALLFLVVGTVENRLGTRDTEQLDSLLVRLPRVGALALTGIAGMLVAPFGIVVAKWAALHAFLRLPGWQGAGYVVVVAFAGSLTLFFWGRLLLKVLALREVRPGERDAERAVSRPEWTAETALAALVVLLPAALGPLSDLLVTPFALALPTAGTAPGALTATGGLAASGPAAAAAAGIEVPPVGVVGPMLLAVLALPLIALWVHHRGGYDEADFYTGGRPGSADHRIGAAAGGSSTVTLGGSYLEGVLDGVLVRRAGMVLCGLALVALVLTGWGVPR